MELGNVLGVLGFILFFAVLALFVGRIALNLLYNSASDLDDETKDRIIREAERIMTERRGSDL